MCDDTTCAVGRRSFLRSLTPARSVSPASQVQLSNGLQVHPRSTWAAGLSHPGPLPVEQPGDVRVLLVHHSASSNAYSEAAVVRIVRGFHDYHTGPKGWPDVAYNFFVDRYGRAFEGRAGSLDGPVIGDATGGNQGFSQLVCLIGDFRREPPTEAAQDTLVALLAHLADTYGVPVGSDASSSFVSRGSNRWPEGSTIHTPTITGHRDMSQTTCPGDHADAIVRGDLPGRVAARSSSSTTTTASTTTTPTTTTSTTTTSTTTTSTTTTEPAPTTTTSTTTTATEAPATTTTTAASTGTATATEEATTAGGSDDGAWRSIAAGGAAVAALTTGIAAVIARRSRLMRS